MDRMLYEQIIYLLFLHIRFRLKQMEWENLLVLLPATHRKARYVKFQFPVHGTDFLVR